MRYMDPELRRFIQLEVSRQIQIILSGSTQGTSGAPGWTEDIGNLYPGADTIEKRPVSHPYGFASRAPRGTIEVVGRQGEHPSNQVVLNHRDKDRPSVDEGTAKMYSLAGYQIYAGKDGIYVGKGSADKPLILASPLNDFLLSLLDLLIAHVHPGPGAPSDKSADFLNLKTQVSQNILISTGAGGLR